MFLFRNSLPDIESNVRFIHAIPESLSVDIYANDKPLYSNISFGEVSNYINIAPGKYDIKLYKAYTYDTPLISKTIEILPLSYSTINITYENKEVAFFKLDDGEFEANPLLSYVRFINLSPNLSGISLSLPDGPLLFDEIPYLETTDYYPVSPGIYNFVVSDKNNFSKFISNINLEKNMFITIYIVGIFNDTPRIGYILTKDAYRQK
ncbi:MULTISPECIES: DUF4397 domain-containing protein [Clostridium]|uniref:DUF4397 domain-containing protein n=1 Tax=Clostridium aquiflavi TaxID=3073603 RepID=A0ABU1EF45_9CLOT|nr:MULTISPECIES: DUF4397 domain-containing protein [unclassified Clostridium]MDR5586584.1 DUF4397 domain-containing protein [Clostridium sp. 5N-1]NFG60698.1 DUF4397 domain-containing protein [Clostridium botulinum]NFQ10516.1 DUF4397 domain-containing protein [Clostridium botulinum]